MMKIKYVTEDDLLMLKNNASMLHKQLISDRTKALQDISPNRSLIKETSDIIGTISLDMSQPIGREALTDGENVQRVYKKMKGLSDSKASDERIWVAYTLSEQLEYMRYRWKPENGKDVLNRFFFNYSIQRSLFRNGFSRLWWIGRVTYAEERSDPFELTKFLCKDQDFIESICGRNIFNNSTVHKATIAALFDANSEGVIINRELVRSIGKYMNLLAGTYLLDALSYNEIYDKVHSKIRSITGAFNDM